MSIAATSVQSACEKLQFVDPLGFTTGDSLVLSCKAAEKLLGNKGSEDTLTAEDKECEQFSLNIETQFNSIYGQLMMLNEMLNQGHDVKDLIATASKSLERLTPLIDQYEKKCKDYETKKMIESQQHQGIEAKLKSTHLHFASFAPPQKATEDRQTPQCLIERRRQRAEENKMLEKMLSINSSDKIPTSSMVLMGGTVGGIAGGATAHTIAKEIVKSAESNVMKTEEMLTLAEKNAKLVARKYMDSLARVRDIEAESKTVFFKGTKIRLNKDMVPAVEAAAKWQAKTTEAIVAQKAAEKGYNQALLVEEKVGAASFVPKTVAKGVVAGAIGGGLFGFAAEVVFNPPAY